MGKDPNRRPPTPADAPAPLPYATPAARVTSQWVTDDGPGGKWLVGCLLVLSVIAGALAAVVGVASFFFGF